MDKPVYYDNGSTLTRIYAVDFYHKYYYLDGKPRYDMLYVQIFFLGSFMWINIKWSWLYERN